MVQQDHGMDEVSELLGIMARLRAPDGCPWDKEQTHLTIRQQLLEECYELVEAIDKLNDKDMEEELGDVLLHVVFHCQLGKERGAFDFSSVVKKLSEKLVRRHPHVFGTTEAKDSGAVIQKWNEIKKIEKPERTSALDGVPPHLPALMFAQEIQKKAGRVGFDWPDVKSVLSKVHEEIAEVEEAIEKGEGIEEEVGDLFFALSNLSRHLKLNAEQACRLASGKFKKRFEWVEAAMKKDGLEMEKSTLAVMDTYWDKAKKAV